MTPSPRPASRRFRAGFLAMCFGALFQSVMEPADRRAQGAQYTDREEHPEGYRAAVPRPRPSRTWRRPTPGRSRGPDVRISFHEASSPPSVGRGQSRRRRIATTPPRIASVSASIAPAKTPRRQHPGQQLPDARAPALAAVRLGRTTGRSRRVTDHPAASWGAGITGRARNADRDRPMEVCSFRLPKVCSFQLPLTPRLPHMPQGGETRSS